MPAPRPIRVLPTLVANQIAAGEVVERPASVVKEIVENALDAGANRVEVELEQGGIELVRITDDGHGIPPEELPLAIAAHATSKIASVDDLDSIATLGFRGEALASIASVSRVEVRSRTRASQAASTIEVEGDRVRPVRPAPGPPGTMVSVRNLFFNTPARRKFLRTVPTEQGRCRDVLDDLALAHPAVGFSLSCDGRVAMDVPPGQSPRERALAILGPELKDELLEVHADQFDDSRGIALWGLIGRPSVARATNKGQHILVNGRAIRDRAIQHALAEGFRGLIEHTRYPTAVLMIEMSPAGVDVNVHPAKAEVRFRDSGLVHSVILRAVRDALRAADLTPTVGSLAPRFGAASGPSGSGAWRDLPGPGAGVLGVPQTRSSPQAFVDYFTRFSPKPEQRLSYEAIRDAVKKQENAEVAEGKAEEHGEELGRKHGSGGAGFSNVGSPSPIGSHGEGAREEGPSLPIVPASRVLQVHKSFLVTQDEQGMVIIDQHALHERAMFEYLLARVQARADQGGPGLESQRLLTPAVIPASPGQVERLGTLAPLLGKIGVEAEPLGPTSIAVHAFPTFLFDRGVEPVEFLSDLFEKAEASDFTPGSEESLRRVLDMMSCKAAVKAGDRLSDVELDELVKLRGDVERSSNCPHGRPTSIRLTIRELEKLFGRA